MHYTKGKLIISYDDIRETDFTEAFPLHMDHNIPAEVCAPSSYVGKEGFLNVEQLLTMQNAGWEVVSHSKNHVTLGTDSLLYNINSGADKIYIANVHRYKPGIKCVIEKPFRKEECIIKALGEDEKGKYVEVTEPIRHNYYGLKRTNGKLKSVGKHFLTSKLRISDQQMDEEIIGSKQELISLGLDIKHFTYPYNSYCHNSLRKIAKSYITARAGQKVLNDSRPARRFTLGCYNFEEDKLSEEGLRFLLDKTSKKGKVCILRAHTDNAGFSVNRLKRLILEVKKRDIQLAIRSQLFVEY
jgi:hypothetical protein